MYLGKGQLPILAVNIVSVIIFSFVFLQRKNYEFMIYIGVIIGFMALILSTNRKINYPNSVLGGLTFWSVLHMSGGGIYINGQKLYAMTIYPIVGEPYNIFKFDQFVHIVGFFVATLVAYHLIKPKLVKGHKWAALSIVVVMAGFGFGALNEVIEFAATVIVPETGVGGYENTALDLVADLIGAVLAMGYIYGRGKTSKINRRERLGS